ncbi:MAG: nucleotidyltransferase family protein [Thermoplasmata archaeon]|nr:nucleotidyltransferase family protein [Thermoplasmata archaeon]
MMNLEEIERILARHKKELYQKYKIKEIGIFGSFVRGEEDKESDVDIVVEFEEVPGLIKFIEIEEYLSKLLGRKVDLVRKPAIRKELKDKILKEVVYI